MGDSNYSENILAKNVWEIQLNKQFANCSKQHTSQPPLTEGLSNTFRQLEKKQDL